MQNQRNNVTLDYYHLQQFFDDHNIDINVNEENTHKKFVYPRVIDPSDPSAGIEFASYEYADDMYRDLHDENKTVLVYDRDNNARRITAGAVNGTFEISEPLEDVIAAPKKPKWYEKLLSSLVSSYRVKVEKYEAEKQLYDAYIYQKAEKDVAKKLDEAFDAFEAAAKDSVSRMDYIMIGGRSLHSYLIEDIKNKRTGNRHDDLSEDERNELAKTPKEYMAKIVYGAMLKGVQVEYLKMDPKTMNIVPNPNSAKNVLHVLDPLPELKKISADSREHSAEEYLHSNRINVNYNTFPNKDARWEAIEVCRKGIIHQARLDKSNKIHFKKDAFIDNVFGEWSKRHAENGVPKRLPDSGRAQVGASSFVLSRTGIASHTVAYLFAEKNMSLEDIFNPDAGKDEADKERIRQIKADAADHVYKQYMSPEGSLEELMKINVTGSRKLLDYLKENLGSVDPLDNDSMFSDKGLLLYAAAYAQFDLLQERTTDASAKTTAKNIVAQIKGIQPDSKEAKKEYDSLDAEGFDFSQFVKMHDEQASIIPYATGCETSAKLKAGFLTNELCRQEAGQKLAANRNATIKEILPDTSVGIHTIVAPMLAIDTESDIGRLLATDETIESNVKFAKIMLSDIFRKNMKVTYNMETNEISCKSVKTPTVKLKTETKAKESVKDNVKQTGNDPMMLH